MKNIKDKIIGFIAGAIMFGSVGALAYSYQASDISYTTTHNNQIENVEQAVNDLYGKLPYYVEYYTADGQTYLGKTAHKYGESSILLNITPEDYTGWNTIKGKPCKTYSKGATVTNLANPGESIKLYAANDTFTGYVYNNRFFEAHYTNGVMDECYFTGDTGGNNWGTKLNGTGIRCDGGDHGSSNALYFCTTTSGNYLNYCFKTSLPYYHYGTYYGSGLSSTGTCS